MNLLVGLAVDNITAVQRQAALQRLAMQVRVLRCSWPVVVVVVVLWMDAWLLPCRWSSSWTWKPCCR